MTLLSLSCHEIDDTDTSQKEKAKHGVALNGCRHSGCPAGNSLEIAWHPLQNTWMFFVALCCLNKVVADLCEPFARANCLGQSSKQMLTTTIPI